jgi:hypothetical protein
MGYYAAGLAVSSDLGLRVSFGLRPSDFGFEMDRAEQPWGSFGVPMTCGIQDRIQRQFLATGGLQAELASIAEVEPAAKRRKRPSAAEPQRGRNN